MKGEKQSYYRSANLSSVPIMELYPNKIREILRFFPKKILASTQKDGGYSEMSSFEALQYCDYVRYNSEERYTVLAVDIDHHQDGGVWLDYGMPQPTWIIYTDRGVQFMWAFKKPILAKIREHRKYAQDVLKKIVYALDADTNAMSYTRVFRNPLKHKSHFSNSRVSLKDFNMLKSPPRGWLYKKNRKITKKITNNKKNNIKVTSIDIEFSKMRDGDGRNVALFDKLRYWAYAQANAGTYQEFDLAELAFTLNREFAEPLEDKEVNWTVASIDKYINQVYNGGFGYMSNTTPEERKEIARKNGKKGGAVSAKIRKAEARSKILAALNQLELFEIKVTITQLAKMAKSDKRTVTTYLKELGYIKSVGWKKQK